jgi:hypothetical protein
MAAPSRMVAAMQRKPTTQRTTAGFAPELLPERAFVLHLDASAEPPRRITGRVEHVRSGRVAHVTTLAELLTFLADVLRENGSED